ncbi:MAG: SemiSWEET transporter [Nanoarchaeota archaeon]|nr:SemiSWEET transporter [Nanoarchaeota archaeon]
MDFITLIGLTAGTLTTVSYFPQLIKSWKTKHTKDISLPMFLLVTLGVALWLVYGILRKDVALIASNIVTVLLSAGVLAMKLKYG